MKSVTFEERQVVTGDAFASKKEREYKVIARAGVLEPGMGEILSQKEVDHFMLDNRGVQVRFVPWTRK